MYFQIRQFWEEEYSPVLHTLDSFDLKLQSRILKRIKVLENFTIGELQKGKKLEKVKGVDEELLYELRLIKGKTQIRMLGVFHQNIFDPLVLINKKTNKLSQKDIKTALHRKNSEL